MRASCLFATRSSRVSGIPHRRSIARTKTFGPNSPTSKSEPVVATCCSMTRTCTPSTTHAFRQTCFRPARSKGGGVRRAQSTPICSPCVAKIFWAKKSRAISTSHSFRTSGHGVTTNSRCTIDSSPGIPMTVSVWMFPPPFCPHFDPSRSHGRSRGSARNWPPPSSRPCRRHCDDMSCRRLTLPTRRWRKCPTSHPW